MKYSQIKQTSRPYEYGEGKEFLSKEEANQALEAKIQKIKTELALKRLLEYVDFKVIDIGNACQIIANIKTPIIFEENQE